MKYRLQTQTTQRFPVSILLAADLAPRCFDTFTKAEGKSKGSASMLTREQANSSILNNSQRKKKRKIITKIAAHAKDTASC